MSFEYGIVQRLLNHLAMSENNNPISNADQENEEQELCTQCMTDNRPGSDFCRECGSPISSYAATGPFESLFAEGHVFRRATENPQRLIVVLGMWMLFGGMAMAGSMIAAISWETSNRLFFFYGLGLLAISLALIVKTTLNYRKRKLGTLKDNG